MTSSRWNYAYILFFSVTYSFAFPLWSSFLCMYTWKHSFVWVRRLVFIMGSNSDMSKFISSFFQFLRAGCVVLLLVTRWVTWWPSPTADFPFDWKAYTWAMPSSAVTNRSSFPASFTASPTLKWCFSSLSGERAACSCKLAYSLSKDSFESLISHLQCSCVSPGFITPLSSFNTSNTLIVNHLLYPKQQKKIVTPFCLTVAK